MNLADLLAATFSERKLQATAEALLILTNEKALASSRSHYPQKIQDAVAAARKRLDTANVDWRGAPIEWRYARVAEIQRTVTTELAPPGETFSDKLDRVLTHKVWGTLVFVAIMAFIFQSIFTFAEWPMHWLEVGVAWAGDIVGLFDPGLFRIGDTLATDGALAFDAVPRFSPEHFGRIALADPMKRKQLQKGVLELSEEGTVQLFYDAPTGEHSEELCVQVVLNSRLISISCR